MIVFIIWTVIAVTWVSHVVAKQDKRLKKTERGLAKQDLQIKKLFSRTDCLDRPLLSDASRVEEEVGEQDCPACKAPLNSHVNHRPCTTSTGYMDGQ